MAKTISIQFMRNDKTVTNFPEAGTKPVIVVTMKPSAANNNTVDIGGKTKQVYALIDTGADDYYVDQMLVSELDLPATAGIKTIQLVSGISESNTTMHNAIMTVDEIAHSFGTRFCSIKTSEFGHGYQVILGCDFIRRGTLTMDPINRVFTLTFPDDI